MELRGSKALVTGGCGGLGRAVCAALEGSGAAVVAADLPGSGADIEADLAQPGGPAAAMEQAGGVDVVVNNAGVEFVGAFTNHTPDELETIMRVNVLAPMELIREVLPGMLLRGRGHVVNMGSLAGRIPSAYNSTYTATKHAIVGLTHSLRSEYRDSPIGFSVVCPGFVSDAGMYGRHEEAVQVPSALGTIKPGRVGQAVVKAIERDRAEIVVNARPVRPLMALAAVAPDAMSALSRRAGVEETWRQVGKRKGRL